MEKIYKVEIAKTPQSIVDAIRFFEMEFGESYLEDNDIFFDSKPLMEFAIKNSYINQEKFEDWLEKYKENPFSVDENFQLIFGREDDEYEPHAISYFNEDSSLDFDEQYEKALLVYGELICTSEEYFDKFVEEFSSEEGNLGYVEVIKAG